MTDATEMEKLQAEVQSLREGLNQPKDCVQDALKYGYTFPKSGSAAPEIMDATPCWAKLEWANEQIARLENEVGRRDAVLDWFAENMPRALDLCPYKLVRP